MNTTKKLCLLGDESVGKSSISQRFADDSFNDKYKATIGVKIFNKIVATEQREVELLVWDIQGGKDLIASPQQYYRGAAGLLFICDITNKESIENIDYYLGIVNTKYPLAKKILLINKIDINPDFVPIRNRFKHDFDLVKGTSAKTGYNINEAFTALAGEL